MASEYKYLLALPPQMADRAIEAAKDRSESLAVWIREAIRQRLIQDTLAPSVVREELW